MDDWRCWGRRPSAFTAISRKPALFSRCSKMWAELGSLTLEHLYLVALSIVIAAAIAIPCGILLTRRDAWRRFALGVANVFQTIPSLALFGILIPVSGIGKITATVAL